MYDARCEGAQVRTGLWCLLPRHHISPLPWRDIPGLHRQRHQKGSRSHNRLVEVVSHPVRSQTPQKNKKNDVVSIVERKTDWRVSKGWDEIRLIIDYWWWIIGCLLLDDCMIASTFNTPPFTKALPTNENIILCNEEQQCVANWRNRPSCQTVHDQGSKAAGQLRVIWMAPVPLEPQMEWEDAMREIHVMF